MGVIMTILGEQVWQRMVRSARGLFGGAPQTIGVDVGSCLMKVVTLQACRSGVSLKEFSMEPVVEESFQDEQWYSGPVKAIQKKMAVPLQTVGISVSGPSVFIKSLILPGMTEVELREHLSLELDRYVALDVQDVFWDVYHRKPLKGSTVEQQEHFLVVAKKEYVERRVDAFHQCGVTVQFVDVDAFALINMVTHNYGNAGSWLLTHIGPSGILMVIILEGEPAYIRKVSYGTEWYGDLLDQVLMPQFLVESKKDLGASETLLLEQFFQEVREHIAETLESFSDISTQVIDGGILLSGGYVRAPGMASQLANSLGMPVNVVNPFQTIAVPQAIQQDPGFQQTAPLLSVAVGVALRGVGTDD
jgi:type IV pilus assembly protein PilM